MCFIVKKAFISHDCSYHWIHVAHETLQKNQHLDNSLHFSTPTLQLLSTPRLIQQSITERMYELSPGAFINYRASVNAAAGRAGAAPIDAMLHNAANGHSGIEQRAASTTPSAARPRGNPLCC